MSIYEQVVEAIGEAIGIESVLDPIALRIALDKDAIEVNGHTYRLAIVEDEANAPMLPCEIYTATHSKDELMLQMQHDMVRAGFVKELREKNAD
jgi:hypothetical protein